MSLLLQIIVTYIKVNIITKLQKLYSLPRNPRAGNKLPVLFAKKTSFHLSPAYKIFTERSDSLLIGKEEKKHILINDFKRFMYDHLLHHRRKHFCCYCLHTFITEGILKRHN